MAMNFGNRTPSMEAYLPPNVAAEEDAQNSKPASECSSYDPEAQGQRRTSSADKLFDPDTDSVSFTKQIESEAENSIKYRTCSWQKTAALLFSEYICLAIMSFPWSYSVLGLVPGLILTIVVAALVLYTSLIVWKFCLRHPEVKDVCDIGKLLFWGKNWAWYLTAMMFLSNNTFIQGFHILVGSSYLNTISETNHGMCTIGFSAIAAVISFVCSLPRTFSTLAKLATASAAFTFIAVILATVFAVIEEHPAGYDSTPSNVLLVPAEGTTFVAGMSAFMNISYIFVGQITIPSFIAEMENPKDFPKALWVVTIAEIVVFCTVGAVVYGFSGGIVTAPAFGSLSNEVFKKVSFSFMIPTLIFLGVLYASVSARFIYFNIFSGTRHHGNHTVLGWTSWAGILAMTWIVAFIIAEVIPFFSDLLSLMGSLFDSFFGFIFWGLAALRMRRDDYGRRFWKVRGIRGYVELAVNMGLVLLGLMFLGGGSYASVQSIVLGYKQSSFAGAFTCASNGL